MSTPPPDGTNDPNETQEVEHRPDESRFLVRIDGAEAVLDYLRDGGDTITFTHTEVPEGLEGRGIGSALARAGLEHARERGLTVKVICPFVGAYLDRHPEYRDLEREGRRRARGRRER